MIVRSLRNIMKLSVAGFAVMGFVAVPILGKTGYERLRSVLDLSRAETSAEEWTQSLSDFTEQLRSDLDRETQGQEPDGDATHRGRP